MDAVRVSTAPNIDGVLDDEEWNQATPAGDFIVFDPYPGQASTQKTEVRILYDNTALYVGAAMYDSAPDSILKQLSQRDEDGNTDMFVVLLDPYNSDINGFAYFVTAAGVQLDNRITPDGDDFSLNSVWQSEVTITEEGWFVEMKIPFSAIRFPKQDVQTWGINFHRRIRRIRENSTWNPLDPAIDGMIQQSGQINGIANIESPVRLSFSPYVSAYLEHFPYDEEGSSNYTTSFNGGMDVKYGINDAFTLDMTLVPDFGQVQSDNQVLNLSPFEVRFNENRQFFTEGTELFNKGGLFYSRRIGGTPIGLYDVYDQLEDGEEVVANPNQSQLVNASKVSGRTKSGLGIGVFNGVTKEMYATVRNAEGQEREILTDPLTNYNVLVFDQNLKNNSYVTLINTNVMRAGSFYDANVTGALFSLNDADNEYNFSMGGAVTQKYSSEPDSPELGHMYNISGGKVNGNFTWEIWHGVESDKYDPNDLGFLYNNNSASYGANLGYNIFEPFGPFLRMWSSLSSYYERLYAPDKFTDFNISADIGLLWKGFTAQGMSFTLEPVETYDYFEPRVWGRYYTWQTSWNLGGWVSTDYRKTFALDVRANYRDFDADGRYRFNLSVSPRIRASDKLMFILDVNRYNFVNDEGAALGEDGGTIIGDDIIFGKRDQVTWENILSVNYIFTNRMGVTFRARHYWATLNYNSFHVLDEGGYLTQSDYLGVDSLGTSLHNNSFDAFTIDMVYRWVFAPGSELSVVWKNSIFKSQTALEEEYFRNLNNTLESNQTNSFSIKILYYIDYLSLKRKSS